MIIEDRQDEVERSSDSSSTGIKARCAIKRAMAPNAQRDVEPDPIAEIAFVIKQKWVNAARRDPCIRNDVDILNRSSSRPSIHYENNGVCCTLFLDAVLSSFFPGARLAPRGVRSRGRCSLS